MHNAACLRTCGARIKKVERQSIKQTAVTATKVSYSVAPSSEGVQAVTVLPQTRPLGGQSEAAGPVVPPAVAAPHSQYIPLLNQEGERGDLFRELHALVTSQFKNYFEAGMPRWKRATNNQFFEESALFIIGCDLEIGAEESTENLREWLHSMRSNPDLFRKLYKAYKKYTPL